MSSFLRPVSIIPTLSLALVALAGCSDDVTVQKLEAELVAENAIDFGDVQVGIKTSVELEILNDGLGVLEVVRVEPGENASAADYEFQVPTQALALGPKQGTTLTVSFQPFADMEEPLRWFFRLHYDCDAEGTCTTFTVDVTGRGISSGLLVEPNPVDFGTVLVGSSHELDVRITNALSVGVDVRTKVDGSGVPILANQGGLGRFELLSEVKPSGSLLPAGTELLGAGASITVRVRYVPDPSQENQEDRGRWVLSNCDNPLCELPVSLIGKGTNAALACAPETLDFGDVNPESTVTLSTRCTNVASETVVITGWRLGGGTDPSFTAETYDSSSPSSLAPAAEFSVDVEFTPTLNAVGRTLSGTLEIAGRNPRANRDLSATIIPVQGKAGGPDIEVTPPELNFGQIALGTTGKRRILVENVGFSDLTVSQINPDTAGTGLFAVSRRSFGVPRGDSVVIEVDFSPVAEGVVMSEILIQSDDSDEGELRIPVQGEGVDLPPCAYTLSPETINFGIVQVLRSTTQGLRVQNVGTAPCLMNDIQIAPGSSSAYRLVDGNETGVMIPVGGEKTIIVEYTPPAEGVDMGSVTFYISDPTNSNREVTLRGVGSASALLISPNEVAFGKIGVNCSTRNRTITVYNTGSQTTKILDVEIPAGVSNEFQINNLPAGIPSPPGNGADIAPGQSLDFTVRYHANDVGQDTGFFHIFEAGRTDPYVVPLYGEGSTDPINEDAFTQLETPEVDIMFVIDNSCSMSDEQASLTSNFESFIQFADAQGLDYQISVVSTDVQGGFPGPMCPASPTAQRPMGMAQGACGYFADGNGDATQVNPEWRLVTPMEQPSPEAAFRAIATQGINGAGIEQGLEAAYRALSSPVITGWNNGFLRQDAYLALIFVSDEEDQSPQAVDFYVNYFRAIKGFRNTNLFSVSAIVGDVPGGCGGSNADPGARYVESADRTGGIFESICTQDWATALQNLGLSVFGYKSRFFLSNQPVAGTVEVLVDGVVIESRHSSGQVRWTYDPTTNSVNFAPLAIPEPGSEIVVRYLAECL